MLAPLSLSLLFWPAPTFYLSCSHLGERIESFSTVKPDVRNPTPVLLVNDCLVAERACKLLKPTSLMFSASGVLPIANTELTLRVSKAMTVNESSKTRRVNSRKVTRNTGVRPNIVGNILGPSGILSLARVFRHSEIF